MIRDRVIHISCFHKDNEWLDGKEKCADEAEQEFNAE